MLTTTIVAILSVAGAVSAQVGDALQNYTSSLNMTIDPNSEPAQTRAGWCTAQTNTCNLLCDDNTNKNDCNLNTLVWDCTCSSNNSVPGLQFYTQTMPTFICEELFSQCITQNANIQEGQEDCTNKIEKLCAKQNPPKDPVAPAQSSASSSSTTAAAAASTTVAKSSVTSQPTASATGSGASSSTSKGFAAPTMAPAGNGIAAVAAMGVLAYLI